MNKHVALLILMLIGVQSSLLASSRVPLVVRRFGAALKSSGGKVLKTGKQKADDALDAAKKRYESAKVSYQEWKDARAAKKKSATAQKDEVGHVLTDTQRIKNLESGLEAMTQSELRFAQLRAELLAKQVELQSKVGTQKVAVSGQLLQVKKQLRVIESEQAKLVEARTLAEKTLKQLKEKQAFPETGAPATSVRFQGQAGVGNLTESEAAQLEREYKELLAEAESLTQ